MKIAILSCSTGGGHNSAGQAIREQLLAGGATCDLINAMDFMPKLESDVISKGHVFAYRRTPRLYGAAYHFEEKHTPRGMATRFTPAAIKLYPFLVEHSYDAVICVHVFPALMMSYIRQKHGDAIRSYFVATDYTCSPGVDMTQMDGYFIPRGLSAEFVRAGLPRERLLETGIPVRSTCYARQGQVSARIALGLAPDMRQVILSCGSMGCGPMRSLAMILAKKLPKDTELTVLCGSNRGLKRSLAVLMRKKRVRVLGYTNQMALWLQAADVLLSKPGGLTSTEAMAFGVPLVCINAVPGCETRNRQYFLREGLAVTANHVPGLARLTLSLLKDPTQCAAMIHRQQDLFSQPAAELIAKIVLRA